MLVEEAVQGLLPRAYSRAPTGGGGTVYLDPMQPRRLTGAFEGRRCRLDLTLVSSAQLGGSVIWVGKPPEGAEPSYLRCEVLSHRSQKTVAVACFAMEGCYLGAELARALEISFESGLPRRGKVSVLRSKRLPPPIIRPTRGSDLATPLGIFHCENPGCPSRGAEVLVRLSSAADAWQQGLRHTRVIAYPCPSCPGSWAERWALTWVRSCQYGAPLGCRLVVDYPVDPTQHRLLARAGSMASVTSEPSAVRWGSVWDGAAVRYLPSSIVRFLRRPRPQLLFRAFGTDPTISGALSACLLSPDNLRGFVDFCRGLPPKYKGGGIPMALALAFNPRRTNNYFTERDSRQDEIGHYHYIAFNPASFFAQLRYFRLLDHPGRFLDVGSGLGEKVFLAFALGRFAECDGLEYDPRTVAVAEFLLASIAPENPYPIRVLKGDALNFEHYGEYDAIYMYRPIRDSRRTGCLIRRIAAQMKVGAILFDVFMRGLALRKMAPDGYATVVEDSDGLASWAEEIVLDDFLVRHNLV